MKKKNTLAYRLLTGILFTGTAASLVWTVSQALRMKCVSDLNFDTPLCFTLLLFIAFMMVSGKDRISPAYND